MSSNNDVESSQTVVRPSYEVSSVIWSSNGSENVSHRSGDVRYDLGEKKWNLKRIVVCIRLVIRLVRIRYQFLSSFRDGVPKSI